MSHTLALLVSLWSLPVYGAPISTDSLRTDAEIRQAVLRHTSEVKRCYEVEGLRRNPKLEGVVDVIVTILPTGAVSDVKVETDSLRGAGAPEVGKCLAASARNWRFERGPYVVDTVLLPFKLAPEVALPGPPGAARLSGDQTTINSR
jgi:hypothetical protein